MNDDKEQADSRQNASDLQPCCDGGSCCTSSSDGVSKNWKSVIFALILLAAGVVLARSFIRKANLTANQGQQSLALIQPESGGYIDAPSAVDGTTDTEASSLWGKPLDSIASLGEAASDTDAVFILLAAEDQQDMQPITKVIEAAAKTIQAGGTRISAFRLMQGAPNYANLTKQLSDPCVLAMVKGCGLSGIPADQITETKLVQAFVTASRPGSACCPPGVSCEPAK